MGHSLLRLKAQILCYPLNTYASIIEIILIFILLKVIDLITSTMHEKKQLEIS